MSASNEKRDRRAAERREEENARKKLRTKTIIVCACVALMIVFVLVLNSGIPYNSGAAAKVAGVSYTAADFNYYYISAWNNYYNQYASYGEYASMFMAMPSMSSSTPVRRQPYAGDPEKFATWGDFLESGAFSIMEEITMLSEEAKKAGFTLSEAKTAELQQTIDGLRAQASASSNGYYSDFAGYLVYTYGKGMTEKVFRRNLERVMLAEEYAAAKRDSFTYSDAELDAWYSEHKNEQDVITYRRYFVDAGVREDDAETPDVDETVTFADGMAKAEETAKDLVSKIKTEKDFAVLVRGLNEGNSAYDDDDATLYSNAGSQLSSDYSEWLLDPERKEGDVKYFTVGTEDGSGSKGCYVIYFVSRDDNSYNAVSTYFLRLAPETVDRGQYDSDELYDAAVKEADDKAREAIEGIKATLGDDPTLDDMKNAYEQNKSVLTEGGEMPSTGKGNFSKEMKEWLFDASRKEGDFALLHDDNYGYFLVYFMSQDKVYADMIADSNLRSDAYRAWSEAAMPNYAHSEAGAMFFTKKIMSLGG